MRLRNFSNLSILLIIVVLASCNYSFTNLEYERGQDAEKSADYKEAIVHYKRVLVKDPESEKALQAARQAARITFFETKDYLQAIGFYNHLIKYSKVESERRESQKNIANIYFEKVFDYPKAILEYNKLLLLKFSNEDTVGFKFNMAQALFNLNRFTEAQEETESAIKIAQNRDKKFDLLMYLGNIFFNTKRIPLAIKTYEEISREFPEKAKQNNVAMNIAVCFEEIEAFDKAIAELENMREGYRDPDFIDLKIKRLKDRKANLPGSKGLRK
ncbi:MAG: tetratricopeptide repeat protein [Bdellovibrionales bacterium]